MGRVLRRLATIAEQAPDPAARVLARAKKVWGPSTNAAAEVEKFPRQQSGPAQDALRCQRDHPATTDRVEVFRFRSEPQATEQEVALVLNQTRGWQRARAMRSRVDKRPSARDNPGKAGGTEKGARMARRPQTFVLSLAVVGACAVSMVGAAGARHTARLASSSVHLQDVSAESATDVWAVGFTAGDIQQPALLHWNGSSLSEVPSQIQVGQLFGVSAVSPSEAWAVGSQEPIHAHMIQTLVLRWDGTRWSIVPSPNPSPLENELDHVWALSANDVWVFGQYFTPADHQHRTFVMRWDGSKWSNVAVPGNLAGLTGGAAFDPISSTSAFAVARHTVRVGHGAIESDEILHWNGHSWHQTKAFFGAALFGVSADSNDDAWAVGYFCIPNRCPPFQTLALHWNGRRWRYSPTPHPECRPFAPQCKGDSRLASVTAQSSSDVWAEGSCQGQCHDGHVVILTREGDSWSRVASPGVTLSSAISPLSATDAWAVGSSAGSTVLLHWNGSAWSQR